MLEVDRDAMIRIYSKCGFNSSHLWTNEQLAHRSTMLDHEDLSRIVDPEDKNVLIDVLNNTFGETIKVVNSVEPFELVSQVIVNMN
ncbi:hypothetical protein C4577_05225 [Candidatus Parcubacteria bacterium]|nr:MAG: hypothetical protein C4577_05225 [Candidatus Parcubacteria bacterium]